MPGLERRDLGGVAVVAAALLYNLAAPPFHLLLPSFVCLVPVLLRLDAGGRPARLGFWFGLLAHVALLNWVAVALWRFRPGAVLFFLPPVLLLGAYTAAAFALVAAARRRGIPLPVAFPIAWTGLEWALARHPLIQYSWTGLGSSLTGFPGLVQIADVVGARGAGFLLAAANAGLVVAWQRRRDRRRALVPVTVVAAGIAMTLVYGILRERSIAPRSTAVVALIQPNVDAKRKWQLEAQDSVAWATIALSRQAAQVSGAALVTWPEVALPGTLQQRPDWALAVDASVRETGSAALVGALDYVGARGATSVAYNSAFLFEAPPRLGRERPPPYHKRSLLPLFERFNGIARGEDRREGVFATAVGRVGVMICYESAFERVARDRVRNGAEILVEMSNDAWFNATTGPSQHFAQLVMRAIETRRGVARAANTGITGFVDPFGRQHHVAPRGVTTFVAAPVVTTAVTAPYVRWGDWLGTACFGVALGYAVWLFAFRRTGDAR